MKNFKRTLAMLLVLCMVFGFLPVGASAALTMGTKPVDGSVTGEPFDTSVSENYRIPGLVNHNGTLIATADARWDYEKDGGGMDLVVSRSEDGNTWNYTFAGYLGDNGNKWDAYSSTLMDPVIISDGTTLYLLADMFPAGYSISGGNTENSASNSNSTAYGFTDTAIGFNDSGDLLLSSDGRSNYDYYLKDGKIYANGSTEPTEYTVKGWYDLYQNGTYVTNLFFSDSPFQVRATSYICMSTSTDGGKTWNDPQLLNVKPEGVSWMVLGPGSGLVTKDGDLAFTAYDNTNIYLIWGNETDGWNRVSTSAAGNESSIIELSDGTIRAFVKRNGSNTIAYVDFELKNGTYSPKALVDTYVTNFSNCMVSSLRYSKTLNGKEVVLVCCPSKPNSSAWNGRFNGKIHMFTLDSSNAMTLVNSYALNSESEFFAYSNMAEKNDGTIAVLYEDDCISYAAGNHYGEASHITYTSVDLEDAFGVTFDETTDSSEEEQEDTYTSEEDVTVHVGATETITLTEDIGSGSHTSNAADVTWSTTSSVSYPLAQLGTTSAYSGEKIDLNDCLYTFHQNTNGTWVISGNAGGTTVYVDAYNVEAKYPNRTTAANVTITESGYTGTTDGAFIFSGTASNGNSGSLHFHTQSGTYYWNQCGGAHAENNSNGTHGIFILKLNGTEITEVTDLDDLEPNEQYLIAGKGGDGNYYVMHPTTAGTSDLYAHLAKVTGETAEGSGITSEITITGKAIGTTSVIIGNVKYNIKVKYPGTDIEIYVGQDSETFTINGAYYTRDDVTELDESIATIDITATPAVESQPIYSGATNVPCETVISGESSSWKATNYYCKVGDSYYPLYAKMSEEWSWSSWSTNYVYSWGYYPSGSSTATTLDTQTESETSAFVEGIDLYTVSYTNAVEASTTFTFTGKKIGDTTCVIGGQRYNITVKGEDRYITIPEGFSKTDVIDDVAYSWADVRQEPDGTIATLDSVAPTTATLVPVTSIESGKSYLIVNKATGQILTNTAATATGNWGDRTGLDTTGTASTDSQELWTITSTSDGKYTVTQDGQYLTISGYYAAMSDTTTGLTLTYTASGWTIMDNTTWASLTDHDQADYCLSDNVGEGYEEAALGTSTTSNTYRYWDIYEIDAGGDTKVTFTGVKAGETTTVIGGFTYHITVVAVNSGNVDDFTSIVGEDSYSDNNSYEPNRSDLDMAGKKITSLRITEGASFNLDVDSADYESVTWYCADPSVATVDENGVVTAVATGKTDVFATVIKNGVQETISIPVTVVPSMVEGYAASDTTTIFYYIENIDYTDPYYTMFLSTESSDSYVPGHYLVPVTEGEVIWYERPTNSAFAWVWTADPWEGYALTQMGSTGSVSQYYPLKEYTDDGFQLGEDYNNYYKGSQAYYNIIGTDPVEGGDSVGKDAGMNWDDALNALLDASILVGIDKWPNYGCDGAMSNTRYDHDGVPKLVTAMTFISDPMPHIEKSVQGILPITRMRADFRPYTDGMMATVGEYVYFNVRITVDRPTIWADEANGIGAIDYSNAIVTDNKLAGAYFYIQKEDDNMDGVLDDKDNYTPGTTEDITSLLNAAWGAEEKTRTIDLYVIYIIQDSDIQNTTIENVADLAWNYQSHYSTGALSGSANAGASIYVIGQTLDNVVIDFGQSIVYEGLTDANLPGVTPDTIDGVANGESDIEAKYGTVTIAKTSSDNVKDAVYTLTYTPTAILQAPDAIRIYATNTDGSRKLVNGFLVYPATTVYYEEGFLMDGSTGWDTSDAEKATATQKFEYLNKTGYNSEGKLVYTSGKEYAYGYDPIYAKGEVGASSASAYSDQNTANEDMGFASFAFTGTGFELFANSTPDSGYISVEIRNSEGKVVKVYMIDTAATAGTTGATADQQTALDTLPIVSVKDLDHGSYTVYLRKLRKDGKTITLDGVRIINTIADSSVYNIDLEDNPEFYQLRDMVLKALAIGKTTSEDYGDVTEKTQQVYNDLLGSDSELPVALITDPTEIYGSDAKVQDLLDNGPKNELYLWEGQTLTFKVTTSRALQIGLKAPQGSANYSLSYSDGNSTTQVAATELKSTEDLFYALGNAIGTEKEYTITVKNEGTNVLSVTDLKVCDDPAAAFIPLEQSDIRSILLNAGYVDPNATDEPEAPVVLTADAVLNIVLVDYTGKRLSFARLITSGPANSTAVFTADEIMAAAKLPKGCDFAEEVSDAKVVCGTSGTVTILAGKVAAVKVTYVDQQGRTVGTAAFTSVQTAPGFFSVTADQIRNAAPEGRTVLWKSGAWAAYGRETSLIVPVL